MSIVWFVPDSFRGRNRLRREHKRPGSAIRRDAKSSRQRKNTSGRENFSLQKDAANVSCSSFANRTFYWPFIGLAHFGYARTVADLMRNWATYNYPEDCFSLSSILWHSCWRQHFQLLEHLAVQQQLCLFRPTLCKKLPWMHLTIDSWLHTALQSLPTTNSMLSWAFALLATTFPGGTLADSVILHNKVMSGGLESDSNLTLESLACLAQFSWHGRTWHFVTTWASGLHSKNI